MESQDETTIGSSRSRKLLNTLVHILPRVLGIWLKGSGKHEMHKLDHSFKSKGENIVKNMGQRQNYCRPSLRQLIRKDSQTVVLLVSVCAKQFHIRKGRLKISTPEPVGSRSELCWDVQGVSVRQSCALTAGLHSPLQWDLTWCWSEGGSHPQLLSLFPEHGLLVLWVCLQDQVSQKI